MIRASSPSLIGRRYQVHGLIGMGNMGVVYRVTDRLTGQVVALKRMTAGALTPYGIDTDGTNTRLALAHEFQLLASLRHPHIISVIDYGFDDERQPYYTMELLENAKTLLRAGNDHSQQARVNLLVQTLQALAYLHRRGILHRDLKPANILVVDVPTENGHSVAGTVKVMDFGLSVMRGRQQADEMGGTPSYMSPEVLKGAPASESADLYALGVVAYELFVGRHPFDVPGFNSLIQNILTLEPEFPDQFDPALAAVIARLLTKDPSERYKSAEAVITALGAATGQPVTVETAATRESFLQASAFVGRDAEMQTLSEALDAALEGRGSAWLVGGESGVGKSRLLNELRTLALVKGALVLRGQAISNGGAPYQMWRSAIRMLAVFTEITAREASVLKPVAPNLGQLLGRRVSSAAKIDPRGAQTRVFSVVTDILKRRDGPTVILLEDVHWADEESLALLAWLVRVVETMPVLIVADYRDDEAPDLMDKLPGMQLLWLARLEDDAIRALSEKILGEAGAQPDVLDFLRDETEGNPFFLVEVIRALAEQAGELKRIGSMELPEQVLSGGIQQVISLRLSRVPEAARPLLEFAAVVGRALDLKALALEAPDTDLDLWLAQVANAAVIDVDEGYWRFAHDKLRDGLIAQLAPERLRFLHERAALALEMLYWGMPEHSVALAYHWRMAGDTAREIRYAIEAGDYALTGGAYQRAQALLERAVELEAQMLGEGELPSADLRCQLGETLYGVGNYGRARDLLRETVAYGERSGDRVNVARALNLLGNIALAFGEYDEARGLLNQTIEICSAIDNRHELGRAMRSLGVVMETVGDHAEAKRLYNISLSIASEVEDQLSTAAALANLASLARAEGDCDESRRLYYASLEQFEAIGFQWGLAWTMTSLGLVVNQMGAYTEAAQLHARAVSICRDIGHKWGMAYCLLNLGNTCFDMQDYLGARAHLVSALRIALEIQTTPLVLDILVSYARLMATAYAHEYAAELIAFARQHPVIESETATRAQAIRTELEAVLTADQLTAAETRAASRTLDAITGEILRTDDAIGD